MATFPHALTTTGKWLHKEFVAAWPVFLFFLFGFLFQLLMVKLVLAKFAIEFSALSNAALGALLAAKAVLILDETTLARHLERYRRIIAVAVKTLIYGIGALMLGWLERILEWLHRDRAIHAALDDTIAQASLYRLLAWAMGVSVVFAIYFSWYEISARMGSDALWSLFFEAPQNVGDGRPAQRKLT